MTHLNNTTDRVVFAQSLGYLGAHLFESWTAEHTGYSLEQLLKSPTMASAAQFLDRAIALNSMYPMHYYNRGSIAFHSQDPELALMYVPSVLLCKGS